jgi:hypothetical protein
MGGLLDADLQNLKFAKQRSKNSQSSFDHAGLGTGVCRRIDTQQSHNTSESAHDP